MMAALGACAAGEPPVQLHASATPCPDPLAAARGAQPMHASRARRRSARRRYDVRLAPLCFLLPRALSSLGHAARHGTYHNRRVGHLTRSFMRNAQQSIEVK
jgi:hypothetical protein